MGLWELQTSRAPSKERSRTKAEWGTEVPREEVGPLWYLIPQSPRQRMIPTARRKNHLSQGLLREDKEGHHSPLLRQS